MGRCVLDTSVMIALERQHLTQPEVFQRSDEVFIPALAIAEFLVGMHRSTHSKHRERMRVTLDAIERFGTLVEFGDRQAKSFAILKAEALSSGIGRTDFDLAMAAHAVVEDAILVTRDKNARLSELTGVVTREV